MVTTNFSGSINTHADFTVVTMIMISFGWSFSSLQYTTPGDSLPSGHSNGINSAEGSHPLSVTQLLVSDSLYVGKDIGFLWRAEPACGFEMRDLGVPLTFSGMSPAMKEDLRGNGTSEKLESGNPPIMESSQDQVTGFASSHFLPLHLHFELLGHDLGESATESPIFGVGKNDCHPTRAPMLFPFRIFEEWFGKFFLEHP
ncbi:hypothetical protein N7492_008564 [Penicillium capsulatum]|uniref:Uncharacterized protein n=1 Tax=Penicillium capsulatum TaxID=69766 RepID=A0A9W9HQY8_9EURO|nr:hypothetical protein N7492_008564 [Penicillium capsulatum]KAJ6105970.1 hypothetical protein N7512_009487 [Penicillium capsulatum]